ncbi:MAG: peptidoglycan DD-metalloendopeptidase family protein [Armatimonadetes bacterium]|nr:peptidoglycan DD-metalloendopeptidase family protein [Armatimonadota bacterium]
MNVRGLERPFGVPYEAVKSTAVALMCLTGTFASAQAPLVVRVKDTQGKTSLWLVRGGSKSRIADADDATPLSWSPDGRWFAIGRQAASGKWRLSLVDTTAAALTPVPLDGERSRPSWAPDAKRFVTESSKGLETVDLSGSEPKVTSVLPTGSSPAWSPSGGRIAFLAAKGAKGVWVAGEDGSSAHAAERTLSGQGLAWCPDGRVLSIVASGAKPKQMKLYVAAANGQGMKPVKTVDGPFHAWSPNGRAVLCVAGGQWGLAGVKDGSWFGLGLDPNVAPDWVNSDTVVGVEKGRLVEVDRKTGTSKSVGGVPEGRVVGFSRCRGLVLDGKFDSPFGTMPVPNLGRIRVQGTVQAVDPDELVATIRVWSVTTSDGMELNLAKSVEQEVQILPSSKRQGLSGDSPLQVTDFVQESEVAVTLFGSKAGVAGPLAVDRAYIPNAWVESLSPESLRTSTAPRTLDYDGVSMDVVTVSMDFPVVGKVNWSDTFLADRDGGNRRHHGQDLMAPKMRPLVAAFDGTVSFNRSAKGHNTITLRGDDGWTVVYMHVNNDRPGTDDGGGGDRYAFAPGLKSGARVKRGQLVGYCGDSGNAEGTAPHCHFELHDSVGGGVLNATPSLKDAEKLEAPVYYAPAPDEKPEEGETRWDGQIVHVDTDRKVLTLEFIGELTADGTARSTLAPKLVYVSLGSGCALNLRSGPEASRAFNDLKPGLFVSVFGKAPGPDQAMTARRVAIGLSVGE